MTDKDKSVPLEAWHRAHDARLVPFAGWSMPVQYAAGIVVEHTACRERAALFDVSHMGQLSLRGEGSADALEALVPADLVNLAPGRARYTCLTNDAGGVVDDLIITRVEDGFDAVVNASRLDADLAHIRGRLPASVELIHHQDRALLALQGPLAFDVLERLTPGVGKLRFMERAEFESPVGELVVSRLGYTGEDGFEISVSADRAEGLAERLVGFEDVALAGLGARDTLRLEAALCLYGNELDERTTPVEAGLTWSIQKRRRSEGGFPGAEIIQDQLAKGTDKNLVGLLIEGRVPARAGAVIQDDAGGSLGVVTSGSFSPSLGACIALGYVPPTEASEGHPLVLMVRNKPVAAKVCPLPFIPHRYVR
ncbi:MAG: glycine cleavage system aminomethyltransferase GcvT [Geminicoccaceae bacterium]